MRFLVIFVLFLASCATKPDEITIHNTKGKVVYTGTIVHHDDVIKDYIVPIGGSALGLIK